MEESTKCLTLTPETVVHINGHMINGYMWTGGGGDRTINPVIRGRQWVPPEPQPPHHILFPANGQCRFVLTQTTIFLCA